MNKAFIFDMDGVIVNSESVWQRYEQKIFSDLIGKNNYLKMKDQILGNTENVIYEILYKYDLKLSKQEFFESHDQYARRVYAEALLTGGMEELIEKLVVDGFKLALVSSSRQNWINLVLNRFNMKNKFNYVLSINDTENVRPKPYPDGYLKAMKKLNVTPSKTIILEDSNKGVAAAKASGAMTICLTENLLDGYQAKGADIFVKNLNEVIKIIETYE